MWNDQFCLLFCLCSKVQKILDFLFKQIPPGVSENVTESYTLLHKKRRGVPANYWNTNIESWRRKWQPTPVFLPGECHGQGSLAGYRPWGRKSQTRLSDWERERENTESMIFSFLLPRMQVKHFISEIAKNSVTWVMKDSLANLVSKTCYLVRRASFKG